MDEFSYGAERKGLLIGQIACVLAGGAVLIFAAMSYEATGFAGAIAVLPGLLMAIVGFAVLGVARAILDYVTRKGTQAVWPAGRVEVVRGYEISGLSEGQFMARGQVFGDQKAAVRHCNDARPYGLSQRL